jgi:hypothetical protein
MEMIPGKPPNVVVVAVADVVELMEHDLKVAVDLQPPEHRVGGDVDVVEVTDVVAGVMDAGIIAAGVVAHLVAVGRFSLVVK